MAKNASQLSREKHGCSQNFSKMDAWQFSHGMQGGTSYTNTKIISFPVISFAYIFSRENISYLGRHVKYQNFQENKDT